MVNCFVCGKKLGSEEGVGYELLSIYVGLPYQAYRAKVARLCDECNGKLHAFVEEVSREVARRVSVVIGGKLGIPIMQFLVLRMELDSVDDLLRYLELEATWCTKPAIDRVYLSLDKDFVTALVTLVKLKSGWFSLAYVPLERILKEMRSERR